MSKVHGFHVHVYYDQDTISVAKEICEYMRDTFELPMGRMHEKNVGPHPRWSCQMTVSPEKIGPVLTWLCTNRKGLTIFTHPESGNDLLDHTEHPIWMGEILDLDLSIFS